MSPMPKGKRTKSPVEYNMINLSLNQVELQENNHSTPENFIPKNMEKDSLVIFKKDYPYMGAFYPRNSQYYLLCQLHHYEVLEMEKIVKCYFKNDIMFRYLPEGSDAAQTAPDDNATASTSMVPHAK